MLRRRHCPLMWPRRVNARIKCGRRAHQGFERHGSREVKQLHHTDRAAMARPPTPAMACVPFRSAKPSLARSVRGLMPARASAVEAGVVRSIEDIPFTNHRESKMRERGEVAAGSHRSAGRNDRMNMVIQNGYECLQYNRPNPTQSFGEHIGTQQQHGADFIDGQRLANAARMAADQVALQGLQLIGSNMHITEFSETRIDAVSGLAAYHQVFDDGARFLDACHCGIRDCYGRPSIATDAISSSVSGTPSS